MYFDEKLKALREEKGLSLSELAAKLDISEAVIEALETGFKDPDKIEMRKLTDFYNVTEDYLKDDDPYVNAFSTLFANSEPGVNPLALPMAFAAGMVNRKETPDEAEIKKIPFVQKVSLENNELSITTSGKHVISDNLSSDMLIAFRANDDSMQYAGILPNDIVIAELTDTVRPEHIAVVEKSGSIALASAMSLDKSDNIIGKVVELRRIY